MATSVCTLLVCTNHAGPTPGVVGGIGALPGHVGGNRTVLARQYVRIVSTGVLGPARHLTVVPTIVHEIRAEAEPGAPAGAPPLAHLHPAGTSLGCLVVHCARRIPPVLAAAAAAGAAVRARVVSGTGPRRSWGQQFVIVVSWTGTAGQIANVTAALQAAGLYCKPTAAQLLAC